MRQKFLDVTVDLMVKIGLGYIYRSYRKIKTGVPVFRTTVWMHASSEVSERQAMHTIST